MENIKNQIKTQRKSAGLSRAEMGLKLGFKSAQTVIDWETGKREPTLNHMTLMAEILGFHFDIKIHKKY